MPQPLQPPDNDAWWNRYRLAHGSGQWQTVFLGYLTQHSLNPQRLTAFELERLVQMYGLEAVTSEVFTPLCLKHGTRCYVRRLTAAARP